MWAIKYAVDVVGVFPYDMLRYDQSFPATQEDSAKLDPSSIEPRRVTLIKFAASPVAMPSLERWKSFGCKVMELHKAEQT